MIRLFSIEYYKLRNTKYFWIFLILFSIFLLSVPFAARFFLHWLTSQGEMMMNNTISPDNLPLFDFVDIWQNLTWIYAKFSIFLGFIVVISVCNEYRFNTIKQNIMDGLSRKEFFLSKLSMIIVLSAVVTIVAFLIGLVMGSLWSPVHSVEAVFNKIQFLGAYFLHLVAFLSFCMLVSLWIKRSGLVIALLIFYSYIVENVLFYLLRDLWKQPFIADLLPTVALTNIIRVPFGKYILQEVQNTIGIQDLAILVVYLVLILWASYAMITRRDLS